MTSVIQLCMEHTFLTQEEAEIIEDLAHNLQLFADLSQSDVFIDCPLFENSSAIVVSEAHPMTAPSLYKTSVVGQYAYAQNEPAVMFCLLSGKPVNGSRGISQEQRTMQQNVVPICSKSGKVIGALIMEQDITEKIAQEKNVERLMETTEQLSETLFNVAMSEGSMQSLMHEGIVLFDEKENVTYTNPQAREMLRRIGYVEAIVGSSLNQLFYGRLNRASMLDQTGIYQEEFQMVSVTLELKAVALYRDAQVVGGFMLIRDISDLKNKEKQLLIKSAVIKEIHHRVKNNLQNVSSLLRLQMRRTKQQEVQKGYQASIDRINSIAIIHEMLAFDGQDSIPFNDVVDRIAKNILSSTSKPEQEIRIELRGDELILPSSTSTTLALVVNELVQNCVTHAFTDRDQGFIEITFQLSGQMARLSVSDNGIGIQQSNNMSSKNHLGLNITETLVKENLNGIMSMDSNIHGTHVQITFPLSQTETEEEELL
ncbi:Two-component sensor histidine kinase, contains HisKA and HATPase domains [Paenibacillus sp. yr247]|uniref:sensor histidine kinase n=1 Tax=Paenibacillus sp. yr247 TaxID=1761880 RepID=UPI0008895A4A|nr:sensor histidine kinase [Paenibacillus sp. yr247]SDN68852.1 Two-component sensor histidine kinase, contains HisKA and HATPase domains [Paenibacillus sp. yr247]